MDIKKLNKIFSYSILFSSIGYFIYFTVTNTDQFENLKNITYQSIVLIFLLKFLNIIFLSNINLNILKNLDIFLTNKNSIELTIKNTLGNLTTPFKIGSGYKLTYLKKNYDFKVKDYLFWTTLYAIINLYPIYFIFVLFSFLQNNEVISIHLYFLLIMGICLLLIPLIIRSDEVKKIFNIKNKFRIFSKSNLIIQFNNILFFVSTSFIVYTIIRSYDHNFSFFSGLSYSFLSSFVNLINVTPGNIGTKEGLLILFNQLHGIGFELVIIVSFIERLTSLITLFLFQILLKKTKD